MNLLHLLRRDRPSDASTRTRRPRRRFSPYVDGLERREACAGVHAVFGVSGTTTGGNGTVGPVWVGDIPGKTH